MKSITDVRREVTTMANRLNKRIKNLSSAFFRVWQIVRGRLLISKIAGVTQVSRQKALDKLQSYNRDNVKVTLDSSPLTWLTG